MRTTGKTVIEDGTVGAEKVHTPKTDAQLRDIALGCRAGTIFGSWMIRESDMHLMSVIFMPIIGLTDIYRKELQRENIVHFYGEEKDRVGGAINGYPMFVAMSYLTDDDCRRLIVHQKALAAFMDGAEADA